MPGKALEERVDELERKVAALLAQNAAAPTPWWQGIVGAFADDAEFEEAVRLGRQYRDSLRPAGAGEPK